MLIRTPLQRRMIPSAVAAAAAAGRKETGARVSRCFWRADLFHYFIRLNIHEGDGRARWQQRRAVEKRSEIRRGPPAARVWALSCKKYRSLLHL